MPYPRRNGRLVLARLLVVGLLTASAAIVVVTVDKATVEKRFNNALDPLGLRFRLERALVPAIFLVGFVLFLLPTKLWEARVELFRPRLLLQTWRINRWKRDSRTMALVTLAALAVGVGIMVWRARQPIDVSEFAQTHERSQPHWIIAELERVMRDLVGVDISKRKYVVRGILREKNGDLGLEVTLNEPHRVVTLQCAFADEKAATQGVNQLVTIEGTWQQCVLVYIGSGPFISEGLDFGLVECRVLNIEPLPPPSRRAASSDVMDRRFALGLLSLFVLLLVTIAYRRLARNRQRNPSELRNQRSGCWG